MVKSGAPAEPRERVVRRGVTRRGQPHSAAAGGGGGGDGVAGGGARCSRRAAAESPRPALEARRAIDAYDHGHVLSAASCVRMDGSRVRWEMYVDDKTTARAATRPRDDETTGAGGGGVAKRARLPAAC